MNHLHGPSHWQQPYLLVAGRALLSIDGLAHCSALGDIGDNGGNGDGWGAGDAGGIDVDVAPWIARLGSTAKSH